MQFSLREFFALTACLALGMLAMMFAWSWVSGALVLGTVILTTAMLIRGLLLRGNKQAFAIGFVTAAVVYAGLLHLHPGRDTDREFNPWSGKLLTSRLMQDPVQWVTAQHNYFIDPSGNKTKKQPKGTVVQGGGGGLGGGGLGGGVFGGGGMPTVTYVSAINQDDVMVVAHSMWTLLFAYVGGKFAIWVYTKREESPPQKKDTY